MLKNKNYLALTVKQVKKLKPERKNREGEALPVLPLLKECCV
jgi:hypothetical protein